MKEIKVYPAAAGGWIYEIWIAARPVVIGWCAARETAELHFAWPSCGKATVEAYRAALR